MERRALADAGNLCMQEAELVSECLYALQGNPSAVRKLEQLSAVYLAAEADKRDLFAAGTLWRRSASSSAVGKVLQEFADAGRVRYSLDLFANFFLDSKPAYFAAHRGKARRKQRKSGGGGGLGGLDGLRSQRKQFKDFERKRWTAFRQAKLASSGLVNQAFAKAVKSIALGHSAALGTLVASVSHRRSGSQNQASDPRFKKSEDAANSKGPIGLRDVTLLELFLHTKELRGQLQALGAICLLQRASDSIWTSDFLSGIPDLIDTASGRRRALTSEVLAMTYKQWDDFFVIVQDFPKGADLLSYLHSKLQDTDSLQTELLQFLFARAWWPYSVFIRSWLYYATVTDPYEEFIVGPPSQSMQRSEFAEDYGHNVDVELKMREGASVPNFLEEVSTPLIRAGQQLQVLLKLPETRKFAQQLPGHMSSTDASMMESEEQMESFWPGQHSRTFVFSGLVFKKNELDKCLQLREERSQVMTNQFKDLFESLTLKHQLSKEGAGEIKANQVASSIGAEFQESGTDSESDYHPQQYEEFSHCDSLSSHSVSNFMGPENTMEVGEEHQEILPGTNHTCDSSKEAGKAGAEQAMAGNDYKSDIYIKAMLSATGESQECTVQMRLEATSGEGMGGEHSVIAIPSPGFNHGQPLQSAIADHAIAENKGRARRDLAAGTQRFQVDLQESESASSGFFGTGKPFGKEKHTAPSIDTLVSSVEWKSVGNLLSSNGASTVEFPESRKLMPLITYPSSLIGANDSNESMEGSALSYSRVDDRDEGISVLRRGESFLAGYLKDKWPDGGLPNNPFLETTCKRAGMFHPCSYITFPENEQDWDIGDKVVNGDVYSKRYFARTPKDPLQRGRRVLAELSYMNMSEFPFLDKHLIGSQGEWSNSHDLSNYEKGPPPKQITSSSSIVVNGQKSHVQTQLASDKQKPMLVKNDWFRHVFKSLDTHLEESVLMGFTRFSLSSDTVAGFVMPSPKKGMMRCESEHLDGRTVFESMTKCHLVSEDTSLHMSSKEFHDPAIGSDQKGFAIPSMNEDVFKSTHGNHAINRMMSDYTVQGGILGDDDRVQGRSVHERSSIIQVNNDKETKNDILVEEVAIQECDPQQVSGPRNVRGGGTWETSMRASRTPGSATRRSYTDEGGEIPFAVVIEKSIIQEIMLQYQSVSRFTVTILQEGLHLRDHYAALRRYFFMETADWADNFIAALSKHQWASRGGQSQLMAVQEMLEGSLQRSSCDGDEFAERLYIATFDADEVVGGPSNASSSAKFYSERLNTFEFINLGYRVDWPLTLVLTPSSLKRYGAIFSFLLRIKSATYTLSDIWENLKIVGHNLRDESTRLQKQSDCFRLLQLFRWQVCHFVTSLLHYLESKLLHVVWSQFLQSAEQQEKDIYDLEALHRRYLDDAANCCFLSNKMAAVKTSVDKILQSVFDFEMHLRVAITSMDGNVLSDHLNSQTLQLNRTFQDCIRHLHASSFRPEYRSLLSEFWACLDHNGFFARASVAIKH